MTDKNYKVLKAFIEAPEELIYAACLNFLKKKYLEKNIAATPTYIYAAGTIPITLVAHLDTVLSKPAKVRYNKLTNILRGTAGLGADDRAGVFLIIKLIQAGYRPNVLFTTGEELGGLGALDFIKEHPKAPNKTNFIIELDRRNAVDAVFYDCGNQEFKSFILDYGFKEAKGLFSDISFIAPAWNIAAVNLSIGYYNEHTLKEFLKLKDLENTYRKVCKILSTHQIPFFSYGGGEE